LPIFDYNIRSIVWKSNHLNKECYNKAQYYSIGFRFIFVHVKIHHAGHLLEIDWSEFIGVTITSSV